MWGGRLRFAKPKEIADMLVMIASDQASFMTGSDVVVDGGCKSYSPLTPVIDISLIRFSFSRHHVLES